jgi:hypothetical protein
MDPLAFRSRLEGGRLLGALGGLFLAAAGSLSGADLTLTVEPRWRQEALAVPSGPVTNDTGQVLHVTRFAALSEVGTCASAATPCGEGQLGVWRPAAARLHAPGVPTGVRRTGVRIGLLRTSTTAARRWPAGQRSTRWSTSALNWQGGYVFAALRGGLDGATGGFVSSARRAHHGVRLSPPGARRHRRRPRSPAARVLAHPLAGDAGESAHSADDLPHRSLPPPEHAFGSGCLPAQRLWWPPLPGAPPPASEVRCAPRRAAGFPSPPAADNALTRGIEHSPVLTPPPDRATSLRAVTTPRAFETRSPSACGPEVAMPCRCSTWPGARPTGGTVASHDCAIRHWPRGCTWTKCTANQSRQSPSCPGTLPCATRSRRRLAPRSSPWSGPSSPWSSFSCPSWRLTHEPRGGRSRHPHRGRTRIQLFALERPRRGCRGGDCSTATAAASSRPAATMDWSPATRGGRE